MQNLSLRSDFSGHELHTCTIVHQEPSSLSNFVSPQTARICESSAAHATSRFRESGVTLFKGVSVAVSLHKANKGSGLQYQRPP